MFRGKQALLLQLCFELLQCKLCSTNAIRKHIVHIQLKGTVTLIKGCTAACHNAHPLFRAEGKTAGICTEHYSLHAAGFIPQGKIAVAAACVLYKVCDLAAQGNIKQDVVCIQQHFNVVVQGRNGNYFSHNPASRAARIETPMALSLANLPGTK